MYNREMKNIQQVIWAADFLLRYNAQSWILLHLELSYYQIFAALYIIQWRKTWHIWIN